MTRSRVRDLKPVCRTVGRWLAGQEALGSHALGAFTGQDVAALHAFVHLVELYVRSDEPERKRAVEAMINTVQAAREKTWPVFREAVAHILDWGDRERLWDAQIAPRLTTRPIKPTLYGKGGIQ